MALITDTCIKNRLLDETYATCDAHEDFVGSLKPHQRTVVKALLDLEDQRSYGEISSSAIVFTDALGSGKTISLINLMLYRPIPKAKMHVSSYCYGMKVSILTAHLGKSLLRPNVVVVGSSVLVQWEKEIARFTNSKLNVLSLGGYHDIKRFREHVMNSSINSFDVVLIKSGNVHWNNKLLPILNIVGDIIGNKVFARVIYDDADTIQMPISSTAIPTLSTIIVTATRNDEGMTDTLHMSAHTVLDSAEKFRIPSIIQDNTLFTLFRVKCSDEYIQQSTALPIVEFYKYTYMNPDDKLLDLMVTMGDYGVDAIVEMINGDAVKTAAAAMNIATNSVADIFQKLIGDRYDNYTKAARKLEIVKSLIAENAELEYDTDENGKIRDLPQVMVDEIVRDINCCVKPEIQHRSDKLIPVLEALLVKIETDKSAAGTILDRVMENIRDGFCQVCAIELGSIDVFILKCCNIILCDECAFKSCRVRKQVDYATGRAMFCGKCAACMRVVHPTKDFIFVNKEFDITRLEDCDATDDSEFVVENSEEPEELPEEVHENPKLNALYHICKGVVPSKRTKLQDHVVRNLIVGSCDIPETGPIKVIVGVGYSESAQKVYEFLTSKGIKWAELAGTASQKDKIVEAYRTEDGPQVLIINSAETCAGLNLTNTTDLILYNTQRNRSITEQLFGRVMRIGKKTNPRIHYLTYTNERME